MKKDTYSHSIEALSWKENLDTREQEQSPISEKIMRETREFEARCWPELTAPAR